MKKLAIAMMLGVAAISANAQMNYKVQTACHPLDVKHYDTERLRSSFMMEKVMAPDEINLTYTLYDRLIYGGVMPVNKVLKLETFRELGPEITYFLERRELGVINVGGDGVVTVLRRLRQQGSDFQEQRRYEACQVLHQLGSRLQAICNPADHN